MIRFEKKYSMKITLGTVFKTILLLLAIILSIKTALKGGDFDVYLDATQKLQRGENIYSPPFIDGLQYYYSVFFALILYPFTSSFFVIELIWSLLSLAMLYRTFKLIQTYIDFSTFSQKQKNVWVFFTLFLSVQFILYNIDMIQITMFLLWGMVESMRLIKNNKEIAGGLILGLIINVKIMPIILLGYLFYRGHFKALIVAVATFIGLLYLPALFIGIDYNQFLLSEWWAIINPGNKEHLFETGIGSHSLVALVPVYLTATEGEMDFKRNIMNLSLEQVELIINLSRLFVFGLSLFFLRSLPFQKERNKLKFLWEISYFIMIIPLLLPHQQKYAFLLVCPMIAYMLYFFIKKWKQGMSKIDYFVIIVLICCLAFYSPFYGRDIIGRFLFELTQHYRILTFATLLLIPIAIYCNPKKINVNADK